MKRFVWLCLLMISSNLYGQAPDTLWTNTYWSSRWVLPWCAIETPDGDFLVGGNGFADGGLIFRLTADGDTLWRHNYSSGAYENIAAVSATADGNYVWSYMVAGHLMKTDGDGNEIWQREYDAGFSWGSLLPTSDGGFVVAGTAP